MKVRNYYSSNSDMYLDVDLTPEYDKKGELLGYHYNNGGWWGSENFRTEMKMGLVQILEADFKPGKYIKKLSIV